jgi:tRNA(adenine34) deaminase
MELKEFLEGDKKTLSQEEIDLFFMKEALKEAKKAEKSKEVPVGAVLVYQNKIISRGHNQVELLQDATAHAEMIALTAGAGVFENWRLLNTTLYCTLEPCIMCAGAMILSRIKRLVFGANDLRVGAAGSFVDVFAEKHPMHQIKIAKNILEEECSFLLQDFFQKRRKKV